MPPRKAKKTPDASSEKAKPKNATAGEVTRPFNLNKAFAAKQNALVAALGVTIEFTSHGTTIGDDSEANWIGMLREFLPNRYGIGAATVVDSKGRQSHQIDVAIYDRQ